MLYVYLYLVLHVNTFYYVGKEPVKLANESKHLQNALTEKIEGVSSDSLIYRQARLFFIMIVITN